VKDGITQEVGIRPPFALESFPEAEEDVRSRSGGLEASPFLPHKDSIRGFVFNVKTGRLAEVTEQEAR
jgi:carbonic anhydrase